MLENLRRNAKYFYFLFALVIMSFVLWVPGMNNSDNNAQSGNEVLGSVGSIDILLEDYWRSFDNAEDLYRDVYKQDYDDARKAELKQSVLKQMINHRMMVLASQQAGITVTDRELQDAIIGEPAFQRDGVFNKQIYLNTLRLSRLPVQYYENKRRDEIAAEKMIDFIQEGVTLSPDEMKNVPDDNELRATLEEALLEQKKSAALLSFLNMFKNTLNIQVNESLII
jgi:hypothetical protein